MKKTSKLLIALFIILTFIVTVFSIKVNATTTGVVTEITVNVREKASIDSDVIMFVTQDDKVEIIEKTGDWYKIKYKSTEGYVYSDFVKVDEEVKITENEVTTEKLESEDEEITKTIEAKLSLPKNSGVKITPNILSNIIYTTKSDENIDVLEQINGWSYISVNNIRGWVRNEQIKEVTEVIPKEENKEAEKEEKTNKNETAYVKYDNVNLRKEPSTDSSVLQKLKLNTKVIIIEDVDSVWNKVKVDGTTGYISKELLSSEKQEETKNNTTETNTTSRDGETTQREEQTTVISKEEYQQNQKKQETTSVTTSNKGQEIVAYAKKYLNYDYVYGGSSPKTGFDCSGFTYYVYKHFGYTLSRSSTGQASNGTKVSKKDLQPGDLVIYKNTSLTRIGHVGIYIGNNKMIHASEPGVGVVITDIDSKAHKYPQRFVMGRRIIK